MIWHLILRPIYMLLIGNRLARRDYERATNPSPEARAAGQAQRERWRAASLRMCSMTPVSGPQHGIVTVSAVTTEGTQLLLCARCAKRATDLTEVVTL